MTLRKLAAVIGLALVAWSGVAATTAGATLVAASPATPGGSRWS